MSKAFPIALSAFVAALVAAVVATLLPPFGSPAARHSSAYDRVMASRTLRCAYFEEAPFTFVDPNTKAKSGIAVDLIESISADLGLKVDWVQPLSFGTITEDLRQGRFDAVCASLFVLPRAGQIDYTVPYAYVPVWAYTQKGRTDFDGKLDHLDWGLVTIAGIDGEGSTTVARARLPSAHFNVLPQTAQIADMLTGLADKKADIAFVMPTVFQKFDRQNTGLLQRIETDHPFYRFSVTFGVAPGEIELKDMLDYMIRRDLAAGDVDALFKKYDPDHLLPQPMFGGGSP